MTHVAVFGAATPQVVAAIVCALEVAARESTPGALPQPSSAWRNAARRETLRAVRR